MSQLRLNDAAALQHHTRRAIDAARQQQGNVLFSTGSAEELSKTCQALVQNHDERLKLSKSVDQREEGANYDRLVTLEKNLREVRERLHSNGISFAMGENQTKVLWTTNQIPEALRQSTGIESIRYEITCNDNNEGTSNLCAIGSGKAGRYYLTAGVSSSNDWSSYSVHLTGPAADKQSEVVYTDVRGFEGMDPCDGSSVRAIRKGSAVMTDDPALDDNNAMSPGLEQFFRHASSELGMNDSAGEPYLTPYIR